MQIEQPYRTKPRNLRELNNRLKRNKLRQTRDNRFLLQQLEMDARKQRDFLNLSNEDLDELIETHSKSFEPCEMV